jgi:hypothetical protein
MPTRLAVSVRSNPDESEILGWAFVYPDIGENVKRMDAWGRADDYDFPGESLSLALLLKF